MTRAEIQKILSEGEWKIRFYAINIVVGAAADGDGENSIQLDARPFFLESIQHAVMGVDKTAQHGDYLVTFRDDQTSYQNIPIIANCMFGNVFEGVPLPLPEPRLYRGNQSIIFSLQNLVDRTGVFIEGFFTVQMVLRGKERTDLDRIG
jgi:hypothetical protein